jgi:type IV pilus assembly protein PilA
VRPGAASASAPAGKRELYEAFVGPEHAGYYVPLFERFDAGGSSASWNWPAALISQWWMIYRGMLLWGFLGYPILVWAAMIALGIVGSLFGDAGGGIAMLVYLPLWVVVPGLYGNKLYHNHVSGYIDRSSMMGLGEQQRREWLIRKGATSYIWVIVALLFFGFFMTGILAAISIPAYQDYTIRSQVSEGAALADGAKTAIAEYHQQRHAMPAANADAGLERPEGISGKYVSRLEVQDGAILVTYGGGANQKIQGQVLAYVPEEAGAGGNLVWHCNTERTTLPNKYRPQACRN